MDAIQRAVQAPIAKITIDRAAGRQVLGKVTPLASCAQHVHDAVERLSHVGFASAASPPRRRNERFNMRPLPVRQVARIANDRACIWLGSRSSTSTTPESDRLPRITTDSRDSTSFETDTEVARNSSQICPSPIGGQRSHSPASPPLEFRRVPKTVPFLARRIRAICRCPKSRRNTLSKAARGAPRSAGCPLASRLSIRLGPARAAELGGRPTEARAAAWTNYG